MSAKDRIRYSLVVASFNRLDELRELLPSLVAQDFDLHQFELILVDDGSEDGTGDYIQSFKAPFFINYLFQENKGPGAARNFGMKHSRGDFILFTDSDCIWPEDYLEKINEALFHQQLDAFGGPDTYHPDFSPVLKAINYAMTSFLGTGGTRGSKKAVARFYPRSFNMGIRREIFEDIGGFGSLRHGQDMDFSARIYDAGYKVGLIDSAVVYHKRRTSFRRFFKQIFNWGVARINLSRIHKEFLKPIHLVPACIVSAMFLLLLLAPFFPILGVLLMIAGYLALIVALIAFIQSWTMYGSLKISLLSVVALFVQVLAYGLGTLSGIGQGLTGKDEAKGFTRNYYK